MYLTKKIKQDIFKKHGKKAENTVEYMVQSSDSLRVNSWRDFKRTAGSFVLDNISSNKQRFYRVISLE